ncbi:hypothetical protein [Paenibacillus sp. FSL H8-0332]
MRTRKGGTVLCARQVEKEKSSGRPNVHGSDDQALCFCVMYMLDM